jgi:hypothetical protein
MPVELVIAPEAELDMAEAYVWYEGRKAGLGEEFLTSVDACLESIRRRPEMYAVVHEGYPSLSNTSLSICGVLRAVGGDGHGLRRISYLSRTRTNGASAFPDELRWNHDGRAPLRCTWLSAHEPVQVSGSNGRFPSS